MNGQRRAPVVVGVDGSKDAQAALDYAAREAECRRRPLRLVHGFVPSRMYGPAISGDADVPPSAGTMVRESAAAVRERYPDIDVAGTVVAGSPAGVLVEESRTAALLVVGSRGLGRIVGLLAGSVSTKVATYGRSPVIVVRSPGSSPLQDGDFADVVVGVDGSSGSASAVRFAFEEAAARAGDLIAVYAWSELPRDNLDPSNREQDLHDAQAEAERLLAEALAGWQAKYPDLNVRCRAVHSYNPVPTLIEEARQAALVVVGSRGRGGFTDLLLGTVSDNLLRHARQPVAIVHAGLQG